MQSPKPEKNPKDLFSTRVRMPFFDFNVGSISMQHKGAGRVAGAAGEGIKVMGAAETCHGIYHTLDGLTA